MDEDGLEPDLEEACDVLIIVDSQMHEQDCLIPLDVKTGADSVKLSVSSKVYARLCNVRPPETWWVTSSDWLALEIFRMDSEASMYHIDTYFAVWGAISTTTIDLPPHWDQPAAARWLNHWPFNTCNRRYDRWRGYAIAPATGGLQATGSGRMRPASPSPGTTTGH